MSHTDTIKVGLITFGSCETDARCFVCRGAGQELGVTDVGPEVVALVSHATQEFLRGLIEKLALMAEHRKAALKVQQSDSTQSSGGGLTTLHYWTIKQAKNDTHKC